MRMPKPRPPRRRWTSEFFSYMFNAAKESPVAHHIQAFAGELDDFEVVELMRPHIMAGFHGVRYQEHDGKNWEDMIDVT